MHENISTFGVTAENWWRENFNTGWFRGMEKTSWEPLYQIQEPSVSESFNPREKWINCYLHHHEIHHVGGFQDAAFWEKDNKQTTELSCEVK